MKHSSSSNAFRWALMMALVSFVPLQAQDKKSDGKGSTFEVVGLTFKTPKGWVSEKPSSSMRKAQLVVPGKKKGQEAEVVYFYFGPGQGGTVQANVDRWFGQFKEPKDQLEARTTKETVNKTNVTFVRAKGTFMSGPPFGQKVPKPGYAMLAAIVETDKGPIFIKMTGPENTVIGAEKDF
ncbi:MAG: hypothetical protein AAF514_12100, partial [Verrucomicrobiota bacterium]